MASTSTDTKVVIEDSISDIRKNVVKSVCAAKQNIEGENTLLEVINSQKILSRNNEEAGPFSRTEASSSSNADNIEGEPSLNNNNSLNSSDVTNNKIQDVNSIYDILGQMVKGGFGIGILGMPYTFDHRGLVAGSAATIILFVFCVHFLILFIQSQYKKCQKLKINVLSYPKSTKHALKQGPAWLQRFIKYVPYFIDILMIIYQLGICSIYIVFIASFIKQITDKYWIPLSTEIHTYLLFLPLALLNIQNHMLLEPFTILGDCFTIGSLSLLLSIMFYDISSITKMDMFGSFRNFAVYFGMTLFALEAISMIIALKKDMKPTLKYKFLNIGMSLIIILYIIVGFYGYYRYLFKVTEKDTPSTPRLNLSDNIKIIFMISMIITYTLQTFVPFDILCNICLVHFVEKTRVETRVGDSRGRLVETDVECKKKKKLIKRICVYACRAVVIVVPFVLRFFPKLSHFISLFGALCVSALSVAVPALIEICILWPEKNFDPFKIKLIKNMFLIVFGLVGFCSGIYDSIKYIVHKT
ncbi:proton-coupled amino acid transporter-like protein CG1139 [Nylanderia fulva]|uniref:proton-coupled amino acid transporter-like protein CG1139 n=1 Tax=Nylanderia fulva TaxID=613905 RepID=UPI0010FB70A2|nr:proton-coupled amino acid transporter-like protein CG1139 [Nylanderia fulva]